MTDIRSRLADALREHRFDWPVADRPEAMADVLLSLPGIAIVPSDAFVDIADAVREDIKQARADGDYERRDYLRGELQGLLQAHDVLAAAVQAQEEQQ